MSEGELGVAHSRPYNILMENGHPTQHATAPAAQLEGENPDMPVGDTILNPSDTFVRRHVGPNAADVQEMLALLGVDSLDELMEQTVPAGIRLPRPLNLGEPRGEFETLAELRGIAEKNQGLRSCIGMGYYDTITPPVIQRNILENPGWYTQYTPYQAEISQGRLEALLNFQTMVADLTSLPLANASLLDEGTAAAEAMAMCRSIADSKKHVFFVSADCHPQTIAVVRTRATSLGIEIIIGDDEEIRNPKSQIPNSLCGVLLQYPTTSGRIADYSETIRAAHEAGALVVMATDLLALTLIEAPGKMGADIAVGSAQRFGVPMGFGGPHAAFMATKNEYAQDAGEDCRCVEGCAGESGAAPGDPDPRAAYSPGEGDEQHLHIAGAAGGDGGNVCRLSWAAGVEADRAARSCDDQRAGGWIGAAGASDRFGGVF